MRNTSEIEQLIKNARKMSPPTKTSGYYTGRMHSTPLNPNNIVFFVRLNESELSLGPLVGCRHHRFVLIINLGTDGEVNVDKKNVKLEPGNAILVFPEQFHWFSGFSDKKICWLFITFELQQPVTLSLLRDASIPLSEEALNDLSRAAQIWLHPQNDPRGNQLHLLLSFMLEELLKNEPTPLTVTNISEADTQAHFLLQKINDFALEQLPHAVGIKQISDHLHISSSHLRVLFRKSAKRSLGHYLRELRINRSIGYLHQKKLNIAQVAAACGFSSSTVFCRAFKSTFKISPLEYRTSGFHEKM